MLGQTPLPTKNNNCCVFVGGLKATFTETVLVNYFGTFGEVESVNLKKNKKMKNINRGFCIVKFKCPKIAERVIKVKDHFIKKRLVTCRPYLKGNQLKESKTKKNCRKIYISSLPKLTTNNDIQHAFSRFGKVEAGYTLKEETGESKGFGFVTFEQESSVEKALTDAKGVIIKGVRITIARFMAQKGEEEEAIHKEATPIENPSKPVMKKTGKGLSKNSKIFKFDQKNKEESTLSRRKANLVQSSKQVFPGRGAVEKPWLGYRYDFQIPRFVAPRHPPRAALLERIGEDQGVIEEEAQRAFKSQGKESQQEPKMLRILSKRKLPQRMGPSHPSKVQKTVDDHQLIPTSSAYHRSLGTRIAKSWHDINVSNLKLRLADPSYTSNPRLL